ncbi:MAG: hypothetical protein PHT77_12230 [Bacteroidales bacterium]|nr:hypothetical protein [Bacteroidales bacterium]MDD3962614.1 hypothetical protein [Bacteroidales bacterium]MDY0139276.1 hypothetical protein [Candidatus Izemoplasmatales bacterium]
MNISNREKQLLINEVHRRFGKELNSSFECVQLSEHISKCTGDYVSAQTLRRFFGFINDNTNPSSFTISILLKYCNRNSLDEIVALEEKTQSNHIASSTLYTIKEFYNIELTPEFDFNFQKACENIAKLIVSTPNLLNELSGFLCSNPISQVFFFERHPYIDGLCGEYADYIRLYIKEKNTTEAKLFGNCLIHLGMILSNRKIEAEAKLDKINSIEIDTKMHPFVLARKIMANLLSSKNRNDTAAIERWTEKAFQLERKQDRYPVKGAYFPFYQFILADAFNLIGHYDESLEMLHIANTDYKRDPMGPIEDGYYEAMKLLKVNALYHTGNQKDCKELLSEINNEEFVFSSKKYFLLQRYHLELELTKEQSESKRSKLINAINTLVEGTGFSYFSL